MPKFVKGFANFIQEKPNLAHAIQQAPRWFCKFGAMNFIGKASSFILCLLACSTAHAYFEKGNAGKEAFSFLRTFDSPRNAAMEHSAGAKPSTDPTITQLNPASIRMPSDMKRSIVMHWQAGDMAENQGSLIYTSNFNRFIYQVSYNWIDYGHIDGFDEFSTWTGDTYNPLSQMASATIAFPMNHFDFGFTLKFASDKLAEDDGDRAAFGAAFDWGITYETPSKLYGFSIMARDFGCILRDYVDDGDNDHYPLGQVFAIAGYLRPRVIQRMTLFMENEFPRYSEPNLNLGMEYALGSSFFVRGGFSRSWLDLKRDFMELANSESRPDEANTIRMLSAGLGYTGGLFSLDYSFSLLAQDMGTEHRIGLRVEF